MQEQKNDLSSFLSGGAPNKGSPELSYPYNPNVPKSGVIGSCCVSECPVTWQCCRSLSLVLQKVGARSQPLAFSFCHPELNLQPNYQHQMYSSIQTSRVFPTKARNIHARSNSSCWLDHTQPRVLWHFLLC